MPPVEEIEARLRAGWTPSLFVPRRRAGATVTLRECVVTLPVMVVLVVSLGWRQMPSLSAAARFAALWAADGSTLEALRRKRHRERQHQDREGYDSP